MMNARSAFGDSRATVVRTEEPADQGAERDQSRRRPADPVERDE